MKLRGASGLSNTHRLAALSNPADATDTLLTLTVDPQESLVEEATKFLHSI